MAPRLSSRALVQRLRVLLDTLSLLVAAVFLFPLFRLWASRLGHPFDLEWMEGGMLAHAWRLQRGLSLYDAPVTEFVPYIYPPGYPAALAALSSLFPLGYSMARALSLAGALAAAIAAIWSVARQYRDLGAGVLGGTLFLLCYGGSGGFYDLARVDGLAIGLLAWAIALGAERRRGAPEAAGLLLCAAFLVKHPYALFGLPIALGLWVRDGWCRALRFTAIAAVPALLSVAQLQRESHGGFLTFVLGVPASHPFHAEQAFPGSVGELALLLGPAWGAALALLLVAGHRRSGVSWRIFTLAPFALSVALLGLMPRLSWPLHLGLGAPPIRVASLVLLGASLGAGGAGWVGTLRAGSWSWRWVYGTSTGACALFLSVLMRGHHGGYVNVLIPGHWALAVALASACAWLRASYPGLPAYIASTVCWCAQMAWVAERNDIERFSPIASDVEVGRRVIEQVRHCRPPVFSPIAPWLPVQAGFEPSTHLISLWDINHPLSPRRDLINDLEVAANRYHWGCILGGNTLLLQGLDAPYSRVVPLDLPEGALVPRAGWRARPTVIRLPPE